MTIKKALLCLVTCASFYSAGNAVPCESYVITTHVQTFHGRIVIHEKTVSRQDLGNFPGIMKIYLRLYDRTAHQEEHSLSTEPGEIWLVRDPKTNKSLLLYSSWLIPFLVNAKTAANCESHPCN